MRKTPRSLPPLPPRVYPSLLPRWIRYMVTATGLLVPAYRTLVEFYPPHDESQLLMDFSRLKIVYQIMERMGIPLTVRNNIHIIKGEQNRMIGGPTSFPAPLLELSPQLIEALKRKNYDDVDPKSDVALGMRTRTIMDEVSNTPVPIMSEWPFKAEREAVIAHELAHLMLNHAQGHLKLNALMAFSACVFFFRPTLSILPLGIYGYSLHYFSRKWELEADRKACTMMGPEITQAMINRHRAKLSLEKMILGHYGLFDAPFRQVILDRLFSFLFHVPLSVRIAYLSDILKEQRG